MNYFIIGDVHGCYYALLNLLEKWNAKTDILISVGDLIDRGLHSCKVVKLFQNLMKENENVIVLKGNHELFCVKHFTERPIPNWLKYGGKETIKSYELQNKDIKNDVQWFNALPTFYETENLFVSHAGISKFAENPFAENSKDGLLWTRSELKYLGKIQVHGHTPTKTRKPVFNSISNSWNIDTGCYLGFGLSAIKLDENGKVVEMFNVDSEEEDKAARSFT